VTVEVFFVQGLPSSLTAIADPQQRTGVPFFITETTGEVR
jgi:hypothetical protein